MCLRIGHRGAKGHATENTISGFDKAISLNVDMIELDVRVCKSGELVVYHDKTLRKVASWRSLISRKTLDELKAIALAEGETIPTLREVLEFVERKVQVNIEVKTLKAAEKVVHTVNHFVTHKFWKKEDFLLCSFNKKALKRLRDLDSEVRLGVLTKRPLIFSGFLRKLNAYSLNMHHVLVSERLVRRAHNLGLKVFPYTVNHVADIAYLKSIGVDGIITDYPEKV